MLDISALQNLRVVLVCTRNPLNMGAAARAMRNFGFDKLRVVRPYEAAFREARSAVGAEQLLTDAEEYETVAEAVADCTLVVGTTAAKERELRHGLRSLQDGAPLIAEELSRGRGGGSNVAILFGSEKRGLSNEDLSHCHWLIHIPTGAQQPSMNLGQAVAVCLYELMRERAEPKAFPITHAACSGDLERITAWLLEALQASGYMDSQPTGAREETVRRLVRRLTISAEDAPVCLGMLRQILWKLKARE